MSNEKQNNITHWRNQLEALDSLPGERLVDKDAAWENLYNRLREKPRLNNAAWYWAAACVLIGMTISGMLIFQRDNGPATNISLEKTNKTIVAPQPPVHQKDMIMIKRPQQASIARSAEKSAHIVNVKRSIKKIASFDAILIPAHEVKEVVTIDPTTTLPSPIIIVAATAPKKQFRIIHINELETVSLQMATSPVRKKNGFIQWKNDHDIQPAAVPEKEYAGVSTIKIPLKN